jgi:hypothetical protein
MTGDGFVLAQVSVRTGANLAHMERAIKGGAFLIFAFSL